MARSLGSKKKMIVLIPVALLALFLIYTIVPSGLPKPISIEFVSAESESGAAADQDQSADPQASEATEGLAQPATSQESAPAVYPGVGQGIMYEVGSRVINLLDPVGRRYLKINIVLEFLPPDYRYYQLDEEERTLEREKLIAEIGERKPVIDDMLTSLLTSRSYEDIYTLQGKSQLRADVQERLNQVLQEPRIVAVYFTEFLVQ